MPTDAPTTLDTLPLTDSDRRLGEALLSARVRTAWSFTALAALATVGFGLRHLTHLRMYGQWNFHLLAILAVALGLIGFVVWWFGWRQTVQLRADLAAGTKHRLRGTVDKIDRLQNTYGETVTHVTVGGVRATSRESWMVEVAIGELLELEVLQTSRVVLSARTPS